MKLLYSNSKDEVFNLCTTNQVVLSVVKTKMLIEEGMQHCNAILWVRCWVQELKCVIEILYGIFIIAHILIFAGYMPSSAPQYISPGGVTPFFFSTAERTKTYSLKFGTPLTWYLALVLRAVERSRSGISGGNLLQSYPAYLGYIPYSNIWQQPLQVSASNLCMCMEIDLWSEVLHGELGKN